MKNLKQYLKDNSYKTIFNKIYSNFLRHDFDEKEILEFSFKFNYLTSFAEKIKDEDGIKVFVFKNIYGFIEIMLSSSYNNEHKLKLNHLTCEEINQVLIGQIINKNKIAEDVLYSFLIWEVLKCFNEGQKQQTKEGVNTETPKGRKDL